MKSNYIFIVFLFLFSLIPYSRAYCQEMEIIVRIEDSNGAADSIIIGKSEGATNGLDESYGELNLYGTDRNELDIRSIQRNEIEHECLKESRYGNSGSDLFFNQNLDLKVDIRGHDMFAYMENCFEMNLFTTYYPVTVTINTTDYPYSVSHLYWVGLYDSTCNFVKEVELDYFAVIDITDNSISKMIFKKDHEVGITREPAILPGIIIRGSEIEINDQFHGISHIKIIDLMGRELVSIDTHSRKYSNIDISTLVSGSYVLIAYKSAGERVFSELFMKL